MFCSVSSSCCLCFSWRVGVFSSRLCISVYCPDHRGRRWARGWVVPHHRGLGRGERYEHHSSVVPHVFLTTFLFCFGRNSQTLMRKIVLPLRWKKTESKLWFKESPCLVSTTGLWGHLSIYSERAGRGHQVLQMSQVFTLDFPLFKSVQRWLNEAENIFTFGWIHFCSFEATCCLVELLRYAGVYEPVSG